MQCLDFYFKEHNWIGICSGFNRTHGTLGPWEKAILSCRSECYHNENLCWRMGQAAKGIKSVNMPPTQTVSVHL